MDNPYYPTAKQTLACVIQCQKVTSLLRPIHIVRLDERTGNIYVLAAKDLGFVVTRDGDWRFDE